MPAIATNNRPFVVFSCSTCNVPHKVGRADSLLKAQQLARRHNLLSGSACAIYKNGKRVD